MLRTVLLFVLATAAALAVPAAYEADPEAFGQWLRGFSLDSAEGERSTRIVAFEEEDRSQPGRPATPLGRKVRLEADARGHFTAEFKLNGRTVPAIVDTGATAVAINESTARRIGLRLSREDFRYRVNTANGETPAAGVTIDRLQIGRISIDRVEALVLANSALSDTLIGMSFLNRLSAFQAESGGLVLSQ